MEACPETRHTPPLGGAREPRWRDLGGAPERLHLSCPVSRWLELELDWSPTNPNKQSWF